MQMFKVVHKNEGVIGEGCRFSNGRVAVRWGTADLGTLWHYDHLPVEPDCEVQMVGDAHDVYAPEG